MWPLFLENSRRFMAGRALLGPRRVMMCACVTCFSCGDVILFSISIFLPTSSLSIAHTYTANHSSARIKHNRQLLPTATTLFTATTSTHPFSFFAPLLFINTSCTPISPTRSLTRYSPKNLHQPQLYNPRASLYPLAGFFTCSASHHAPTKFNRNQLAFCLWHHVTVSSILVDPHISYYTCSSCQGTSSIFIAHQRKP